MKTAAVPTTNIGALVLLLCLLVGGCQDGTQQQLENQLYLMQERLVELETQLSDAQAHSARLAAAVDDLDAYVRDVEIEVIDLSGYVQRDLLLDLEATVANARSKLDEVRSRTDALGAALRAESEQL